MCTSFRLYLVVIRAFHVPGAELSDASEVIGAALNKELLQVWPALRVTNKPYTLWVKPFSRRTSTCALLNVGWVLGDAVYCASHFVQVYHLLCILRGEAGKIKWAKHMPCVAYMMNTSMLRGRSERPLLALNSCGNRLGNADVLPIKELLYEGDVWQGFDPGFGLQASEHRGARAGSGDEQGEQYRPCHGSLWSCY